MKHILSLLGLLLVTTFAMAQTGIEMADTLRSSGKIYVVVAVIAVIFAGLAAYLFSLDKRLKKIERNK